MTVLFFSFLFYFLVGVLWQAASFAMGKVLQDGKVAKEITIYHLSFAISCKRSVSNHVFLNLTLSTTVVLEVEKLALIESRISHVGNVNLSHIHFI